MKGKKQLLTRDFAITVVVLPAKNQPWRRFCLLSGKQRAQIMDRSNKDTL
jgi:hypothetical protein